MGETPRPAYARQWKLIKEKATYKGLGLEEVRKIMTEKEAVSRKKFPGESEDWQDWFAESCKFDLVIYMNWTTGSQLFPF